MLKLKTVAFSIVTLCSAISFSQTNKMSIGIEVGPTINKLSGNDILKYYSEPLIGFSWRRNIPV